METIYHLLGALTYDPASKHTLFFNTVLFAILFTPLLGLQIVLAKQNRVRVFVLLAFSLYFYYKFSGFFVVMMACTALIDFLIAYAITLTDKNLFKKFFVVLSVTLNIGLIAYFKYATFFLTQYHDLFAPNELLSLPDILAPIGISFYSFKSISYVLDVYYESLERPENDFSRYLLHISFFPTILAGPINSAKEFLPQLRKPLFLTEETYSKAFFLLITGFFKKAVIADYLAANYVNRIFDAPELYTGFENLMALYSYGIYIFNDFCGYTDMALGIALLLGFSISHNFNEPFKATNISEFWRRWHISLSQWFNVYVFSPLNFDLRKLKTWGVALAVLVTFFLSGLWHGPNWTFILWGFSHGLAIAFESLTARFRRKHNKKFNQYWYRFASILITFHFLALTYPLFACKDLTHAASAYTQLFTSFSFDVAPNWLVAYYPVFIVLTGGLILHYLPRNIKSALLLRFTKLHWTLKAIILFVAIVVIYQVMAANSLPFAYLKF